MARNATWLRGDTSKHHALRRLAHPLKQRKVAKPVRAKDFEHLERLVADVLDKVAHVLRHNAHVARHVIKRARVALGRENGDARAPADKVGPLVGDGVPVHLAQRARLDDGVRGGDRRGEGKVAAVGDAHLAARRLLGRLVEQLVRKLVPALLDVAAARALVLDGAGLRALENVLFAFGEVLKDFGGEVEVFGNDALGRDKSRLFGKAAIVKDEQKLGAILAQALERMGDAAGKVPEVALVEVVDKVAAFVVERGDADASLEHIGPFSLLVPVKLTDDARVESHVDASQLDTAHVGDIAVICARRAHHVRALARAVAVIRPEDGGSLAVAPGQGIQVLLLRVDVAVELVAVARRVGAVAAGGGGVLVGQGQAVEEALLRAVSVRQRGGQAGKASGAG
ncbi:hypothetical protein HC256_003156 [Beauveria bassiana]|nr:hypothetical protein HC256_003156 [Beauveria bassiana]